MDCYTLDQSDIRYPTSLPQYLGDRAPAEITALGNLDLLKEKAIALYCSLKCPGNLILRLYDFAQKLRSESVTVIGGFHSSMEKECLDILLRGKGSIIVCPARSIEGMRILSGWTKPLEAGGLLLLSPFDKKIRRPKVNLAEARNQVVAALADEVFIAHASAGGKTMAFAREVLSRGKPLFTLKEAENSQLIELGAKPVEPKTWMK